MSKILCEIDLKYIYNLPKDGIQDEWFILVRKCLFHLPQSLSLPRHFDTLVEAVFQNLLNNPRIVFVEYEPAVIPFY